MKLYTDDEQFDVLHAAVDKVRKSTKEVKVPRQTLLNLLMDHSNMYGKLKQMGEMDE